MINYQEDTILQIFKSYLEAGGYLVLSSSGKQQGLYRFNIGDARKGPDIIALKGEEMLVGEGKKRSAELFKEDARGISDYNSLQYVLDNVEAQNQIVECIPGNLKRFRNTEFVFSACIVGSTTYINCLSKMTDSRIRAYKVDVSNELVEEVKK